ncbi:hypothetical protein TSOC_008079 [Tetrabaena socialis]|uniref:Uncharacterized protein n=1 Tax=Tetrabaena socialis TaxID=47790 RepID=A0A2J7ZZF6_9CHLO|nr:hypothetical protein TSOC_008079 [Tetrabaena socialis]|eukprot:PNH05650.1 hypothetical protein TSOC_008079 [Tetrabaena socialis]
MLAADSPPLVALIQNAPVALLAVRPTTPDMVPPVPTDPGEWRSDSTPDPLARAPLPLLRAPLPLFRAPLPLFRAPLPLFRAPLPEFRSALTGPPQVLLAALWRGCWATVPDAMFMCPAEARPYCGPDMFPLSGPPMFATGALFGRLPYRVTLASMESARRRNPTCVRPPTMPLGGPLPGSCALLVPSLAGPLLGPGGTAPVLRSFSRSSIIERCETCFCLQAEGGGADGGGTRWAQRVEAGAGQEKVSGREGGAHEDVVRENGGHEDAAREKAAHVEPDAEEVGPSSGLGPLVSMGSAPPAYSLRA